MITDYTLSITKYVSPIYLLPLSSYIYFMPDLLQNHVLVTEIAGPR